MGGEARRARWDQEAASAVWEPEEGHAGELHFAQVCVCVCVFSAIIARQCKQLWFRDRDVKMELVKEQLLELSPLQPFCKAIPEHDEWEAAAAVWQTD